MRPSLGVWLALLVVIFLAVPVVLYVQFSKADADKQILLLAAAEERGRLVTESLAPDLERAGLAALPDLGPRLQSLAGADTNFRLLFRPVQAKSPDEFYYVASAPALSADQLEADRITLKEFGVLDSLAAACAGERPGASRHRRAAGGEEVVTSLTPLHTAAGCWVLVSANSTSAYQSSSIGQPYWMTPEVRFAAAIYLAMAVITIGVFFGIWRSLSRFARHAREVRAHGLLRGTFLSKSTLPEFDGIARELDRLVMALEESARTIRQAAEENAHAFKTPIAVISQSVEPLKRLVPAENERGRRAIGMIENSIERLDVLISCARRMDEMVADLIDPPIHPVDLSELLERVMEGCSGMFAGHNLLLRLDVDDAVVVLAGEEMLETVIENLVENAVHFSSPQGAIAVKLRKATGEAVLTVDDNGPGVRPEDLERIFDRYYSRRPDGRETGDSGGVLRERHFGIGLWIVRRNLSAIGGSAAAENRREGGLRLVVRMPLSGKA